MSPYKYAESMRNKCGVLTNLRRWDGTGYDTKKRLERGCLWTESKQTSKGSSPVGEGRCTAGNGTTLGGWHGTAVGAREVVEGTRSEHRKIKS